MSLYKHKPHQVDAVCFSHAAFIGDIPRWLADAGFNGTVKITAEGFQLTDQGHVWNGENGWYVLREERTGALSAMSPEEFKDLYQQVFLTASVAER